MPPVTTPIEREPTEETENAALNGFPPHFPGLAMSAVLGPAGQAAYAVSDVFSDFKVSTLLGEFAAGLQDWVKGDHDDPDNPNTEAGRRRQSEKAAQDMFDAFDSYAYRQEWLDSEHTLGNVTMTGAEYVALSDRLKKDPAFLAAVQKGLADRGYTGAQQQKLISDYHLWTQWSQIPEEKRIELGVQERFM